MANKPTNGLQLGASERSLDFINTSSTMELTGSKCEKEPDTEKAVEEFSKTHPTSDLDALIHVVKSSLGSGVLAMAEGFKNGGMVIGIVGTIIVGILCTHCSYIMVKCSQDLCAMLNKPFLGYVETCEQSMRYCANKRFSKYATFVRNSVESFMFFTYYGVNTVYILLVANSFQNIVESHFDLQLNIRYYILITAVPIFAVGIVRNMKYLVPFSAIANVFLAVGFCLTFYYIFQDLPPLSSRPAVAPITQIPLFFSTVLFGMEGIGTILPIENSMKNPSHFLGCPGVLNIAMSIVVTLFISIGMFGYLKFGDASEATITLNLPQDALAESVKALVALAILFSYGLQLTASMDVVWKRILPYTSKEKEDSLYYKVRAGMIVGTVLLAIAVPNLGPVISLIGAVGFSMCGFFFPVLVQTVIAMDKDMGRGEWYYLLTKNFCMVLITVFALVTGSVTSVSDIIREYS